MSCTNLEICLQQNFMHLFHMKLHNHPYLAQFTLAHILASTVCMGFLLVSVDAVAKLESWHSSSLQPFVENQRPLAANRTTGALGELRVDLHSILNLALDEDKGKITKYCKDSCITNLYLTSPSKWLLTFV